jgi:hypothetical protein
MNSLFIPTTSTATRCLRYAVLGLLVASIPALAQEPRPFLTKTTIALFSADALVRTMDAASTVRNLNNPCKCFVETGVGSKHVLPEYGYSLAVPALAFGVGYWAHKHHHRYLETGSKLFAVWDVAYDGQIVIHNDTATIPAAPPTGWAMAR